MAVPVSVDVPERLRLALIQDDSNVEVSSWAVEALVIEAIREGRISRGLAGEILGLSFHEREQLFADRGLTYDLDASELDADELVVKQLLSQE